MHRLLLAFALALTCTAPPSVAAPSPSSIATPSPAPSATPSPPPSAGALTVTAAGDVRGDHSLVLQIVSSQPPGGISQERVPSQMRIWDVPLDGGQPRLLVAYTQGRQILTETDYFDFARQLSPDGRRLVVSDPVEVAGTGLLVIDLVAGTTRTIDTAGGATQPAWSPDGAQIAYRGFVVAGPFQKETGLWTVSASGGVSHLVWDGKRAAGAGTTQVHGWTGDGSGIGISPNSTDLGVVDVSTGALTRMTVGSHGVAWRAKRPSVAIVLDDDTVSTPSPTGPRGAPGSIGRAGRLDVRDSSFAVGRVVARYGADVGTILWSPKWNPVSDEIVTFWACGQGAAERDELVIVDAVSGARRALQTAGCVRATAWSREGTKILYTVFGSVRVIDADGSNDRELFRPALPPGETEQYVGGVTAFAPR